MVAQIFNKILSLLCGLWLLTCSGCMTGGTNEGSPSAVQHDLTDPSKAITVTEDSFVCLSQMQPVRGFFVGNLLGKLDDTLAIAKQPEGRSYPAGTIVQLVPSEAMVKHHQGWNPQTNDWEFFELKVSEEGTKIKVRGTTQVVNKFGGNCFECHQKAQPQWDLICEEDHGCDPLPIPDFLIRWTQEGDPRCD